MSTDRRPPLPDVSSPGEPQDVERSTVSEMLHAFGSSTLVVRAVGALAAAMPGALAIPPYEGVEDAALDPAHRAAVRAAALEPGPTAILALGAAVDGADRALTRQRTQTSEELVELQTRDAVFKALAIAALGRMVGGAERLLALPTGPVLVATWAAVDVALPLGGVDLPRILAERQPEAAGTLVAAVGSDAVMVGVPEVLGALLPRLRTEVDQAVAQLEIAVRALAPYVPGILPPSDERTGDDALPANAAETIAVHCDRLPIYKWLAARLAAESTARHVGGR